MHLVPSICITKCHVFSYQTFTYGSVVFIYTSGLWQCALSNIASIIPQQCLTTAGGEQYMVPANVGNLPKGDIDIQDLITHLPEFPSDILRTKCHLDSSSGDGASGFAHKIYLTCFIHTYCLACRVVIEGKLRYWV